jgi:hypothetical protein
MVHKMTFTFEQNIPVPPAPGAPRYPFRHLKIGESVLYECTDAAAMHRAYKAAHRVAEYRHWQIVTRKLSDGVRVWRVA